MGEDKERAEGSYRSGSWSFSRDHKLGDVALTAYKAEIKNTMVEMGDALFSEFTTGIEFDWAETEPVRPVTVKIKQPNANGHGFRHVDSPYDEVRDGPAFGEIHIVWRKLKAEYVRNKRKSWPFLIGTINEEIKVDVMGHPTFEELQSSSNSLGLWKLLEETSQGVCANNVSLLTDE
jgi:hypothetical protein